MTLRHFSFYLKMSDNSTMSTPCDTNLTAVPVVKLLLVLLLRAGSLIVQIGTFPTDNVYNIISQNIIDVAVTITSFLAIGYPLYSGSYCYRGLFGYGTWLGSDDADIETAINGVCACLVGTHIITSLLSGRLHTKASIIVYSFYSGIILPITMHWAWTTNGWMKRCYILSTDVAFVDYNGGVVIHCSSGLAALIGSLFLGRRLLRLKDLDESSLSIGFPGIVITGYFLITFGIIGVSLPTNLDTLYMITINSAIAVSLSISTVFSISKSEQCSYWELLQCFQGGIAALVMLSSGVDSYFVTKTFLIAIMSSILFTVTSKMIYLSPLEDYGNIVSIHVINGFIAVFLPKIWNTFQHNIWQLICSMVILSVHAVAFTLIFYLLSVFGIIRNESDKANHIRSQILVKNTKTSPCSRVFSICEKSITLQSGKSRKVPETKDAKDNNNASVVPSSVSMTTNSLGTILEERHGGEKTVFTMRNENVIPESKENNNLASGDGNCAANDENVVYKLQDLMLESKNSSKESCVV